MMLRRLARKGPFQTFSYTEATMQNTHPYPPYEVINAHTHVRNSLNSALNLGAMLEANGLAALNVASMSDWRGDRLATNALALWLKALYPGRIYALGGLHYAIEGLPAPADASAQAAELVALGFDGAKMIEGKPTAYKAIGKPLDDPFHAPLYAACQAAGLPILMHIADPDELWDRERLPAWALERGWFLGDGTFPTKEQLYAEVDHILETFPDLKVILAHFYFLSNEPERAARFLERFPNASFDITPGGEMYAAFSQAPDEWRAFFQQHRARILLGTDNGGGSEYPDSEGWASAGRRIAEIRRYLETEDAFEGFVEGATVHGLGLDEATVAAICGGNWRRIAGAMPRPVDTTATISHCEALISRLAAGGEAFSESLAVIQQVRKELAAL
jgi:predicted TIM-barrel fold metal-dependent hydrolase